MSRIEVPMPQMGESIAEGTVSKWLKELGDTVERDEPILEISTDKVDAEIPAPSAGTLVEISVEEGETVEVGTIVAYIDPDGGAPEAGAGGGDAGEDAEPDEAEASDEADGSADAEPASASSDATDRGSAQADSAEERLRTRSTPVVRRIAEEHGVDIAQVDGTGHAGRVTKQDILDYIESAAAAAASEAAEPAPKKAPAPESRPAPAAGAG